MYQQATVAAHLRTLPHVREEMARDSLEFQVGYNPESNSQAGYASTAAEFRVDGRVEDRNPPAPLALATIGSNGRDTVTGQVHFIGIDIDGANHAKGHENLDSLIDRLKSVPWLRIMRSRSGRGFHLYVFPARTITAESNSEVYPLGAAIVARIGEEIGDEDFASLVDCAGSLMYYASPNPGERGYEVLKDAELFTEDIQPLYDPGDPTHAVADLKELEPDQIKIVDWLHENAKKNFHQVGSSLLFHAHTSDLSCCHEALNLRGQFQTVASGTGDTKRNCCLIAIKGGAFLVVQWGSSNETSWKLSKRGCRYTTFNAAPSLGDFVEEHSIIQNQRTKAYCFTIEQARELADLHGVELPATDVEHVAVAELRGMLTFEIDVKPTDKPEGWQRISKQKACFKIEVPYSPPDPASRVRLAYDADGVHFQVYRRVHRNHWQQTTPVDGAIRLKRMGLNQVETDCVLNTDHPLRIVNEPFKGEFLGKYEWNRGATQLAFPIAPKAGDYDHWKLILDHCGEGLNEPVANDEWCKANNIKTGADYLFAWSSLLLRHPKQRLPGAGFCSYQQNCGKSTFFNGLGMLMTRGGYVNGPSSIVSDFNKPLMGCVLLDLDDVDLGQRHGELYTKIQSWMTADWIEIVGKGTNAMMVANTLHIGHTANREDKFCIKDGDTRWVITEVQPLKEEIPADKMRRELVKEAPYFLRALFDWAIPSEAFGRHFLPVLDTPMKLRLMASRSDKVLHGEQATWFKQLKKLADEKKLEDFVAFDALKEAVGEISSVQAFKGAWPRLATALEDAGYQAVNRQNGGGRYPAAWKVIKVKDNEQKTLVA